MNRYLHGFIHDIRTAVGVIRQCCEKQIVNDPEVDHERMMRNQAEHALQLIEQLETTLSSNAEYYNAGPITSLKLRTFLEEFVGMYPKVHVRFDCESYGEIFVDLSVLQRVLDNCIQNAIRAGKSDWVLLTCDSDDEVLNLHVKDRGCGMDKKQLERIGLGFSTTGGGTGTKILIDLLVRAGGVIRWNSIKDIGTCVTITFKLIDGHHH